MKLRLKLPKTRNSGNRCSLFFDGEPLVAISPARMGSEGKKGIYLRFIAMSETCLINETVLIPSFIPSLEVILIARPVFS